MTRTIDDLLTENAALSARVVRLEARVNAAESDLEAESDWAIVQPNLTEAALATARNDCPTNEGIKLLVKMATLQAWNAAIKEAANACTDVIANYSAMDETGTKYLPMKTQKAARSMVSIAREDIIALMKGGEA